MEEIMENENTFVKMTREALENYSEDRVAVRGFEIDESDSSEEDCVLIIGLNPAGTEQDATRERDNMDRTYFYSVDKIGTEWNYKKYYGLIYDVVAATLKNNVKWHWCNKKWDQLSAEINQYDDLKDGKILEEYYKAHKDNKYTIYIGDMFYYHETNAGKLPLKIGKNKDTYYHEYCLNMLKKHIEVLKDHNKTIKYIYINNAKVSRWLSENKDITYITIEGVRVFWVLY